MATIDVHPERWDEVIADTDGPQIVVGGPGTGKTEFLVRRAVHLIGKGTDPASIAVLGFSRRGAAEIRNRIEARLGHTTAAVAASTYHSLAMRIIESFGSSGGEPPALLTAPEQVAFVADLLAVEDPADWAALYQPLLRTSRFAQEVTDFLLRCAEQRIGPDEVDAYHRDDWRGLPGFFAKYIASLETAGRLDYGSLIVQAVDLLDDDEIGSAVSSQFRYVLADEYQDTSHVQARFLQSLAKHHRHLTAAADPYQSVYSFRGTDLANVGRFPDEFRDAGGRPARRLVLTTSFRVPGEILRSAEALTHKLDLPGAAGPVVGVPSAGRVDAHRFDQATEEAEWIAREIERTHIVEGTSYDKIAVFVRTKKRFMSELSRALERRGIPHNRPDSRLVDHPAVRILFDLVTAATTSGADRNRSLRRLALGPLLELPPGEFHRLSSEQETRGWDTVLREHSPGGSAIAELISDETWATRFPAAEGLWHIWETLPQLAGMANDPDRRDERFGWSSMSQVLGRQFERDESVTLHQYLGWTEKDDFEADPLLRHHATQGPEVTLTSLHQAKGLEFDTVFIADAVEGVFPDLRSRESLLGSRHLSSSLPTGVVEYRRFRLQEEARLAYTAMTRASRRVVWTATSAGDDFRPGGPSRFLDRLGVEIDHPPDTARPVSLFEGEAWLRRIAADPAAGGHARSAAIENLATGPTWGGRDPARIAGVLRRGSDRGITIPGQLRLSPSQADSYARCPRQYALERRLKFSSGPTAHLTLGNLVHRVIHLTDDANDHPSVGDAIATLDEHWNASDFGGPPWSVAWYARAREMLENLYEHRNPNHEVVASEREVAFDAEGVRWSGSVDRIERRGSHLWIVDFKTSKSPAPADEVARSIQLGFYVLATKADPEIAQWGDITGAELWYPAVPQQRRAFATRQFNMAHLPEVRATMAQLAADVEAERWDPVPGDACRHCTVRSSCPAVPEGQEAYIS